MQSSSSCRELPLAVGRRSRSSRHLPCSRAARDPPRPLKIQPSSALFEITVRDLPRRLLVPIRTQTYSDWCSSWGKNPHQAADFSLCCKIPDLQQAFNIRSSFLFSGQNSRPKFLIVHYFSRASSPSVKQLPEHLRIHQSSSHKKKNNNNTAVGSIPII